VEEQMANALQATGGRTPATALKRGARRLAEQHRTVRERQKQALNLQRENILSQKRRSPGRRAALEAALAQIEGQIQAMG
jgi:hypothetical protein